MAPLPALFDACPLAVEMLADLPPFLHDEPDVRAVIYCQAKEAERKQERIAEVRAQFSPVTATEVGLPWWEALLHLPTSGDPVIARRAAIVGRIQSLSGDPAGLDWIVRLNSRLGPAWTYQEHITGDASTPPPQTLRVELPWAPGTSEFINAVRAVREETPAELDLQFVTGSGFILDVSQMDIEGLGI